MAGEIIRKDDPTSHGGVVLEGSLTDICMGKPIAYIGHKVQCPQCKGAFPIIEGVMTTTLYGKGVAVAGMKTACGAVLVATQFTDTVEVSSGAGAAPGSQAPAARAATAAAAAAVTAAATGVAGKPADDKVFDEQFALVDENKRPLYETPYTVKLPSGELFRGITDLEGRTERFVTDGVQQLEIYIGHD
jgi:uncharacterized Zn-binding protein involved in type VI secretion